MLSQQSIYDAGSRNDKFVPVLLTRADEPHVPEVLRPVTRYCVEDEEGYAALFRRILHIPAAQKPVLGELKLARGLRATEPLHRQDEFFTSEPLPSPPSGAALPVVLQLTPARAGAASSSSRRYSALIGVALLTVFVFVFSARAVWAVSPAAASVLAAAAVTLVAGLVLLGLAPGPDDVPRASADLTSAFLRWSSGSLARTSSIAAAMATLSGGAFWLGPASIVSVTCNKDAVVGCEHGACRSARCDDDRTAILWLPGRRLDEVERVLRCDLGTNAYAVEVDRDGGLTCAHGSAWVLQVRTAEDDGQPHAPAAPDVPTEPTAKAAAALEPAPEHKPAMPHQKAAETTDAPGPYEQLGPAGRMLQKRANQ
jgi:hypothetical protein